MMEATLAQRVQLSATWVDSVNSLSRPTRLVRVSRRMKEQQRLQVVLTSQVQHLKSKSLNRSISLVVPSCYKNFTAPILESGSIYAPSDEALILKNKSQEIEAYLSGRCIYLVGMMGSGKTTVGKIIAQTIGYSFCDCDSLIEEEMDGTSVAEIFKLYGVGFFRDKETEVLQKLSIMHNLVVSTGGGAVVRPINWRHMHKGISVWIDVPLEALAQRIAAVGTASRPLLHIDSSDDAYSKALGRLSSLFEERGEAYANANARVCLENIAAKLGYRDVSSLSPTMIAIEALEQIEKYLEEEGDMEHRGGFL